MLRSCLSATTRTADLFQRLRSDRPENSDPTKRFPASPEVPRHAGLVGMRVRVPKILRPSTHCYLNVPPFPSAAVSDS